MSNKTLVIVGLFVLGVIIFAILWTTVWRLLHYVGLV